MGDQNSVAPSSLGCKGGPQNSGFGFLQFRDLHVGYAKSHEPTATETGARARTDATFLLCLTLLSYF